MEEDKDIYGTEDLLPLAIELYEKIEEYEKSGTALNLDNKHLVLVLLSRLVLIKEKYITKNGSQIDFDYDKGKEFIPFIKRLGVIYYDTNFPKETRVIVRPNEGISEEERNAISYGIEALQNIRNAIAHGSYKIDFKTKELIIIKEDGSEIRISLEQIEKYIILNYNVENIDKTTIHTKDDIKDNTKDNIEDNTKDDTKDDTKDNTKLPIEKIAEKYLEEGTNETLRKVYNEYINLKESALSYQIDVSEVENLNITYKNELKDSTKYESILLDTLRDMSAFIKGKIASDLKFGAVYTMMVSIYGSKNPQTSTSGLRNIPLEKINYGLYPRGIYGTVEGGIKKAKKYIVSLSQIATAFLEKDISTIEDITSFYNDDEVGEKIDSLISKVITAIRDATQHGNMELAGNNITMYDQSNMTQEGGRYIKLETEIDSLFMITKKYQEITSSSGEEITPPNVAETTSLKGMDISVKNLFKLLDVDCIKFKESLSDDLKQKLGIIEAAQKKLSEIIKKFVDNETKTL